MLQKLHIKNSLARVKNCAQNERLGWGSSLTPVHPKHWNLLLDLTNSQMSHFSSSHRSLRKSNWLQPGAPCPSPCPSPSPCECHGSCIIHGVVAALATTLPNPPWTWASTGFCITHFHITISINTLLGNIWWNAQILSVANVCSEIPDTSLPVSPDPHPALSKMISVIESSIWISTFA